MNKTQINHFENRANDIIRKELSTRFKDTRKKLPDPQALFDKASDAAKGRAVTELVRINNGCYRSNLIADIARQLPAYVKAKKVYDAEGEKQNAEECRVSILMREKLQELVDGYVFGDDTSMSEALKSLVAIK